MKNKFQIVFNYSHISFILFLLKTFMYQHHFADDAQENVWENFQIPLWAPAGGFHRRPGHGGRGAASRRCGPPEGQHGIVEGVQGHEGPLHRPHFSVRTF